MQNPPPGALDVDRATAIRIVANRLRTRGSAHHRAGAASVRQRARDLLIEILPYRHGFTPSELDDLASACVALAAPAAGA